MPAPGTARYNRGRPRRGAPRRAPPMRKKTNKTAYQKSAKNQMSIRRAPIVETKQRVASDIATINGHSPMDPDEPVHSDAYQQPVNFRPIIPDDAFEFVPLDSFYRASHGFEDYNCIGNSIYSKYLNFKIQFRFPDNGLIHLPVPEAEQGQAGAMYQVGNKMIEQPSKLYLICGWVTEAWNCPIEGATNAVPIAGSRPSRDSSTQDQLQEYIKRQIEPYFDDSTDKLMFRERVTSNIKIDKYVRIKPNLEHAIATKAVPTSENIHNGVTTTTEQVAGTGSIPDVLKTWSVKTGRKINLTEGTAVDNTSHPVDNQNLYPNHSWLPFALIYNPDWKKQADWFIHGQGAEQYRFTTVQCIQYRFNDAHYFTDG